MAKKRVVRSQDVADQAGVSRTTVSLVLNHHDASIPEKTRQKVIKAADDLGFVPSAAGRVLQRGRGTVVLCLTVDSEPSLKADEATNVLSRSLHDRGLTCLFSKTAGSTTPLKQLLEEITPSVVVPFFQLSNEDKDLLKRLHIPLVEFFRPSRKKYNGLPPVELFGDFQESVGAQQAGYLMDKGCERIAYVGTTTSSNSAICGSRLAGVRRGLTAGGRNLVLNANISLHDHGQSADALVNCLVENKCDGVCVYNDQLAALLISRVKDKGIEIPRGLRIIGVDNDPIAAYLQPSLTSIDYDNVVFAYIDAIVEASGCGDNLGKTLNHTPRIWVVERQSA